MMSRMAPRMQRTSLVSAAGGNWKCMPRNVPFLPVSGDAALGDDRLQTAFLELLLAEAAGEEASFVLAPFELDDEGALELGLGEDHGRLTRRLAALTAGSG